MTSALVVAVAAMLLGGCGAPSVQELEEAATGLPAVRRVEVREFTGDPLPWQRPSREATVSMEEDATADEVAAVFAAYGDDDGSLDIGAVTVLLDGPKHVRLLVGGSEQRVTRAMIEQVVAAQTDPDIVRYRREEVAVIPSVSIVLQPTTFDEVVRVADGYTDEDPGLIVDVESAGFRLGRDPVNEDQDFVARREALVLRLAAQVPLRGALVSGRGPLRLRVRPGDEALVRRLIRSDPAAADVARIVVKAVARTPG